MDDHLRELERRAKTGDETARLALGHEWVRRGRGWNGEDLDPRMKVAKTFPLYTFDTRRGFAVEMLRVATLGIWIAKRPTRWRDYERWRTTQDGSMRTRRIPTDFGSEDDDPVTGRDAPKVSAYCDWIGCRLPRRRELEAARSALRSDGLVVPTGLSEWFHDGAWNDPTPVEPLALGPSGITETTVETRLPDLGFRPVF